MSVNVAITSHWRKFAKAKKEAVALFTVYARNADVKTVPPLGSKNAAHRPKRRVTVVATGWRKGRLPDPDNLLKLTLDALKGAHLIVDDSAEWCEAPPPVVKRVSPGELPRTVITLEDLT